MKMSYLGVLLLAFPLLYMCACQNTEPAIPVSSSSRDATNQTSILKLPTPKLEGEKSLEQCLLERRSIREYADLPLTLQEVSQLLWAGQGITTDWGGRTAPSAGGLYPLEVYLVASNVENLDDGVYKYLPQKHELGKVWDGDVSEKLAEAALSQSWVKDAAINIIITGVYERTTIKYGDRGRTYVHMEAGHAAQNICLQGIALNLGMVTVGAFHDDLVKEVVHMSSNEVPLYVMPVGKKRI